MTEARMTFVEHLDELRTRIIASFFSAALGMFVAYFLYEPWILNLLKGPLDSLNGSSDNPFALNHVLIRILRDSAGQPHPAPLSLHFIGPLEVLVVKMRISFSAGLILVSPFILYQAWAFVVTGLTDREKRAVRVFFPVSLGLFLGGVFLAYVLMLPVFLYFLVYTTGAGLVPTLILDKYVSLVVWTCLIFGLMLEMPLVMLFLSWLDIVSPAALARHRRYAILLIFIIAAILTPPDVISQFAMAIPMLLLYEVSIWVARIPGLQRKKEQTNIEAKTDE